MKAYSRALLQVHSAVILFGFAGLFGKWVNLHPLLIVLGRTLFAWPALWLFARLKKMPLQQSLSMPVIFTLGLLLAVHWTTFFWSIQLSSVTIGLLTFALFPVFVTFLEPLILKTEFKSTHIYQAALAFIGVALIIPEFHFTNHIFLGCLVGSISGLTFALLSVLNRKYVTQAGSLQLAFSETFITSILLLPVFIFVPPKSIPLSDIGLLFILGTVFTAGSHTLFIEALHHLKTRTSGIIASLEPVYGIVLAFFIFHEVPDARTWIGGIIILAVSFQVSVQEARRGKNG